MEHLIDLDDFELQIVEDIVNEAVEIKKNRAKFSSVMADKIMSALFFEPSTRTQFSFQTAMYKLGGHFLNFTSTSNSSIAKGESFSDTVKIMSIYSDVLVVRHKNDGAARAASLVANCPVINAGDGIHLHPTQTLTDMLTIKELKNTFEGLTIGFCGDLKYGRPVNSLVKMLCRYNNNRFVFISTNELKISKSLRGVLEKNNIEFEETNLLEESISKLDVLYVTRIQRERFKNFDDYEKQKGRFKLTNKILSCAKNDLIVLHPLPRVDEIDCEVDVDSRAAYFLQAANGVFARMALVSKICGRKNEENCNFFENAVVLNKVCSNENCIVHFDKTLPALFKKSECNNFKCAYCDELVD